MKEQGTQSDKPRQRRRRMRQDVAVECLYERVRVRYMVFKVHGLTIGADTFQQSSTVPDCGDLTPTDITPSEPTVFENYVHGTSGGEPSKDEC